IKQLAKVIDERLDARIGPIIDAKLAPIKQQLDKQGKDIGQLKTQLNKQGKDIQVIKVNVDVLIKATNRDDMRLQKRVKRIEDHLDLPPLEEHPGAVKS